MQLLKGIYVNFGKSLQTGFVFESAPLLFFIVGSHGQLNVCVHRDETMMSPVAILNVYLDCGISSCQFRKKTLYLLTKCG